MAALSGLLGGWQPAAAAAPGITAYNTYIVAPYFTDAQQGLARTLVERLNQGLGPAQQLTLRQLPRARLDATELNKAARFDGVVLFINPRFVGDAGRSRFLWSKPLFVDCNLVISRQSAPLKYDVPASLEGLRFGGVRGYRYAVIDDMVKAGKLLREDSQDELSGLRKVLLARVDVTIVPYTIYAYYAASENMLSRLYVASTPHQCFSRHILVGRARPELLQAVNQVIDALAGDKAWQAALRSAHLDVDLLTTWTAEKPID